MAVKKAEWMKPGNQVWIGTGIIGEIKQIKVEKNDGDEIVRAFVCKVKGQRDLIEFKAFLVREKPAKKPKEWKPDIVKSKRVRIYERDGYACVTCGSTKELTLDHKIPRSKGGSNDESNLQTMCFPCNNKKGNKLIY